MYVVKTAYSTRHYLYTLHAYCKHASRCSVQCAIGTNNSETNCVLQEKGWDLWFQRVKDRFVLPTFRSEYSQYSEYSDRNVGKTNLSFTR